MSKKTTAKKIINVEKKVKVPKFKLLTYTLKAVIPTGQYANIQPEITVQAETIELAERAVMPYIEALFAKYRDGGVSVPLPVPVKPTPVVVSSVTVSNDVPVKKQDPVQPVAPKALPVDIKVVPPPPAIILTVPHERAKKAIISCTSVEALNLVKDQIEKSVKLIDREKLELLKNVEGKRVELNSKWI